MILSAEMSANLRSRSAFFWCTLAHPCTFKYRSDKMSARSECRSIEHRLLNLWIFCSGPHKISARNIQLATQMDICIYLAFKRHTAVRIPYVAFFRKNFKLVLEKV